MKHIILFLLLPFLSFAQGGTWPVKYSDSDPSGAPSAAGTRIYFNTATNTLWFWEPAPSAQWRKQPKAFDQISGCATPAYTPTAKQSTFAVNSCTPIPELYQWTGAAWVCLNCATGATYTAGAGIAISGGNVISNTRSAPTVFPVSDSAAFRAFNTSGAEMVIMTDSLRGGEFRRCYACTADQYMVFSDASGRKWERFNTDGRYNVKWFGAKGDSIQDDRSRLQFVADHVNTKGGGTIYMPPGVYKVSTSIITGVSMALHSNTTLQGSGWKTKLFCTDNFPVTSGAVVCSRSGNADQSQAKQDSGNVNINVWDLAIQFQNNVPLRGNGVTFGGVVNGSIRNVWVHNNGGYGIHIVKNNDTALKEGKRSENIVISDCLVTNFSDTGIEFSGTNNCAATNCVVEGKSGFAIISWNGSTNTAISNCTVKGTANTAGSGIMGVFVQPSYNPLTTPNFKQTAGTTITNCVIRNAHDGIVIGTSESPPIWGRTQNTVISNCIVEGKLDIGTGLLIGAADTVTVTNCNFVNFSRSIDVSSTQYFDNQRDVNYLNISDCLFDGTTAPNRNEIVGVNELRFNNNIVQNTPGTGITFRGIRGGTVSGNTWKNIGTSGNQSGTVFTDGNGTSSRPTRHLTITDNRIVDERATKTTAFNIQFTGATDSCVVMGNDGRGGKSGGLAYLNVGTGTAIKHKDIYTGESYNTDGNTDVIADAVLTTNSSAQGVWMLKTSLVAARNGLRSTGGYIELGNATSSPGAADRLANIYHRMYSFGEQWTDINGVPILYVKGADASGVGIGTATPLDYLHVSGGGAIRLNSAFRITTDGADNGEFTTKGSMYYYPGFTSLIPSGQPKMSITTAGVGVRTDSPLAIFHVNGNSLLRKGTYGESVRVDVDEANHTAISFNVQANYAKIQTYGIGTGTGVLSLNPEGNNIAIGGTSATEKLHITGGTIRVDGFTTNGNIVTHNATGVFASSTPASIVAAGGVVAGTYTPTLTNVTNVTSSTAKNCQYSRSGNIVTVFGSLDVTTTLAVATEVGISLPVASALAATTDANGVANASSAIATNGYLEADATSDRAALKFIGLSVSGAGTIFFSFSYTVL